MAARRGSTARTSRAAQAARTTPDASTSTPCSPTRPPASSSAAAPAGSARPPRRPRSGLRAAEAGRQVVVLTIDPARRLAQSLGLTELDNTPRPVAGIDADGRRVARRDDARHEAHLRRGRRGALHPREGRADPGQPLLPVAVSSSFAGTQEYMAMEKLGQLRAEAERERHLGPHRRRHPAVALGAGLPRRPQAARLVPRRALHPAAHRARPGPAAGPTSRCSRSAPRSRRPPCSKVLGGQLLADVQTFVAALDTMFGGFRERADVDLRPAQGAGHGLPRRRRARARRPARGGLLRRPARERGDAARRPRRQPDADARRAGAERPRAALRPPSSSRTAATARPTTTWPSSPPALLRLHADLAAVAARHARARRRFVAGHPGIRWSRCRRAPRTSTTSRACARGAATAGSPGPGKTPGGRPVTRGCRG